MFGMYQQNEEDLTSDMHGDKDTVDQQQWMLLHFDLFDPSNRSAAIQKEFTAARRMLSDDRILYQMVNRRRLELRCAIGGGIYWDYGVLQAAEVLESKFCTGSLLDDIQQQQNIGTIVSIANSVGTVVKVIVCPPNKVISMEVLQIQYEGFANRRSIIEVIIHNWVNRFSPPI